MKHVAVFAALLLSFAGHSQAQNNQPVPDLSLEKAGGMGISYSKEQRIGQILVGNQENKIQQYFDVWGKSPKDHSPVVITYALDKRTAKARTFYTATFGKGPVERNAFNPSCLSDVPDFKDSDYWAATITDGRVQFEAVDEQALNDAAIKVMFRSVKGSIQRAVFESVRPMASRAPYDDQRILADLLNKEENRKAWYTRGWLRPENRCVRYLQTR